MMSRSCCVVSMLSTGRCDSTCALLCRTIQYSRLKVVDIHFNFKSTIVLN